jgi:hypothetical protein
MPAPGDANVRHSDQTAYLLSDAVLLVKPRTAHFDDLQSLWITGMTGRLSLAVSRLDGLGERVASASVFLPKSSLFQTSGARPGTLERA